MIRSFVNHMTTSDWANFANSRVMMEKGMVNEIDEKKQCEFDVFGVDTHESKGLRDDRKRSLGS
jgi:hypothetical protein